MHADGGGQGGCPESEAVQACVHLLQAAEAAGGRPQQRGDMRRTSSRAVVFLTPTPWLCCHGECREAASAGPSNDGGEWDAWPRESEERDGWQREPDDSAMMEAYFDAKCGGEDGDWADIAFEVSLYEF